MAKRRDTLTALLFLAGLLAGAVFLLSGLHQEAGFAAPVRPDRSTLRTKQSVLRAAAPDREPLTRSKLDPAAAVRPDRRPPRRRSQVLSRELPRRGSGHAAPSAVSLEERLEALDAFIDGADPAINESLDRDHAFIQLYGGIQKILGRRVVEDADPQYTVVKLTDRLLTFVNLNARQVDMTERAEEMLDFARRVRRECRVPVLYVQAPSKLDMAGLPEGVADYSGAEADQFLALLEAGGMDALDLRPAFRAAAEKDPEAAEEYFFHTDHHWTPRGAFLGCQVLCEKLEKDYLFELEEEWTDLDSFSRYPFEDVFLGSQGRRVGTLYAGLDDFEIWSPKFSTDFTYTVPLAGVEREGPFAASLLFPERLAETDYYATSQYTIYSGGDYLLSRAYNRKNPDGKRVLILRDSFGCALTPFLSIASGEVMAIDPRQFNGGQDTMLEFVDWLEPDVLIVMNTTGSLRVDRLFPYLPSARQAVLRADGGETEG